MSGTTVSSGVTAPGLAELCDRADRARAAVAVAERQCMLAASALAVTDHTDADRVSAAAHHYAVTAAAHTYARAVLTMAGREVEEARERRAQDDERPAPGGPASSYTTTDLNREPAD